MTTFKRIISFLLAMVMVMGMLPMPQTYAEENEEHEHQLVETVPATTAEATVETTAAPTTQPEETALQEETEAPTEPTVPATEETVPEMESTVPEEVVDGEIIDDDSVDKVYPNAVPLTLGQVRYDSVWGDGRSGGVDCLKFVIENTCEVTIAVASDSGNLVWRPEAESGTRVNMKLVVGESTGLSGSGYNAAYRGTLDPDTYYIEVYNSLCYAMNYAIRVDAPGGNHKHNWKTRTVAPTCTSEGYTEEYCTGCDEYTRYNYVDTIPHKEVRAEREAPTCSKPGKEKGTKCSSCGKTMSGREEIPKLPHDTKVEIPMVEPTCTTVGKTVGAKCSVCGAVSIKPDDIPKLPHDTLVEIPMVEPTCTTVGKTTGAKCSVCGSVSLKPEDIPKLPHPEMDVAYVPATCTSTGLTAGTKCSVCNAVVQAQIEIPKLAHTEANAPGVAATCTKDGKANVKVCSVCQKEVGYNTIPKLGHDFAGYFCSRCGIKDDNQIKSYGICGDNLTWVLDKNSDLIISGTGDMWDSPGFPKSPNDVIIEEGVTSIGANAFKNSLLDSVSIPKTVTKIGKYAFRGCSNVNFSKLVIPEGVQLIDDYAFAECYALTRVSLPSTLTKIGAQAFYECYSITSLVFPKNLGYIGDEAFYGCQSLADRLIIPDSVHYLGELAFSGCTSLTGVTLGNGLTQVSNYAFSGCKKLSSVTLGNNITTIQYHAFAYCAISVISLINVKQVDGEAFLGNKVATISLPTNISIGSYAFNGSPVWTVYFSGTQAQRWSVSIGSGNGGLSNGNASWEYATSGSTSGLLWTYNNWDYQLCITGNGSIANYSSASSAPWYSKQNNMKSVIIGSGVMAVGKNAFNGYSKLKEIKFLGSAPTFADNTIFKGVTATVYYPGGDTSWTEEIRQNYGGTLTWVAYCSNGHKKVEDAAVPATCTEPGLTTGYHCSVCGVVTNAQEVLPALGHKSLADEGALPTCTETGMTTGSHCGHCGLVLTAQEVIPALGHTPKTDAALAPTCEQRGLTEGSHCDVCQVILVQQEELPVTGHNKEAMPNVPATCYEKGSVGGVHCATCGRVFELPRKTPMLSHIPEPIPAVAPTCTEDGATEGSHCVNCGEIYVEPQPVPALDHDMISDKELPPTCTEPGRQAGAHCSRCDYTEGCSVIPALGHSEVVDAYTAPTCTETGLTEGSHCKTCGEVFIEQEIIPAMGHDFSEGICQVCGAPDKADYDLFSGKSLTLKEINPDTGKAYTAKQLTWAMGDEYEPFATLTAAGKLTAKKVFEKTRIEIVGTIVDTGEIITYLVDIYPAVTQVEAALDGNAIANNTTVFMDYTDEPMTIQVNSFPEDTLEVVEWSISDKKGQYAEYAINGDTLTITNPKSKAGTVTVKATVNAGVKKTVTVKVQFGSFANTVAIEAPEKTTLRGGETMTLKAAITDPESVTKAGITWTVSDKTAASITATGKLTAKNVAHPTTVTVTATSKDGQASDSVEIKILPKNEGALVLVDGDLFVTNATRATNLGDVFFLEAYTIQSGEPVGEKVIWTTSKASIAQVDENGRVTAVGNGTAKITATAADGRKAVLNVKVSTLVSAMEITTKDGKNLIEEAGEKMVLVSSGKNVTLTANILTAGAAKTVTWEITEGANCAKIATSGKITANKDLTSVRYITVKATAKDGSGTSATIRIKLLPLATGVQIYQNGTSVRSNTTYVHDMLVSDTIKLSAKVYPAKANQQVELTSSNKKVAEFVDGELVCHKPGTVTITAKALDGSNAKTTFKLTIVKKVTSLTLKEGSNLTVIGGKSLKLAPMVEISPSDATNKKLTWSVAPNEYGIKISTAGVLSTKKVTRPVTVNVMVLAQDGSGKMLSFDVTVNPA